MKKLPMILLGTAGIAVAMLVIPLTPVRALDPVCGPVSQWIRNCTPGGVDHFDSTGALVGIDLNLDCARDISYVLKGPVDVERQAPSDDSANFPNLRPVDGIKDVIDTEIVNMSLTGNGITLMVGKNTPGIYPNIPRTLGAVAEQADADAKLGDSFFHVFFEVTGVPGGPVYSHTPLKVEAVISYVPPHVVYMHPTSLCLPLFNDPVGGVPLYNLVSAYHDTGGVGGLAELPGIAQSPGEAGPLAEGSGWSAGNYAALAGGLAAVALFIAVGGWYARRRSRVG